MHPAYTIFPLGDSALTVDFGNKIDDAANRKVLSLFKRLQNRFSFIQDIIPAYSSLSICYDVTSLHTKENTAFEAMKEFIAPFLETDDNISIEKRQMKIPVCYAKKFALDLDELTRQKNISAEHLIQLHTTGTYRVYMIGFLPGFAYMGRVDEQIAAPRRPQPRTSVPAGSVGIAGEQTGIYPLTSPGGWNIIGRTPLKIFDAAKDDAGLFQPGDEVNFYSITEDEFENYQGRNS